MNYDDTNSRKLEVGDVRQKGDVFYDSTLEEWITTTQPNDRIIDNGLKFRRPFTTASEKGEARPTDAKPETPTATDAVAVTLPNPTPRTTGIFATLDRAFLNETGYEYRIALREAARIGTEDLENELTAAQSELESRNRLIASQNVNLVQLTRELDAARMCLARGEPYATELQVFDPQITRLIAERDAARKELDEARAKLDPTGLGRNLVQELDEANNYLREQLARVSAERDDAKLLLEIQQRNNVLAMEELARQADQAEAENAKLSAGAAAMRTALFKAKSLVIKHHDSSIVQRAGCPCPVCSPDGKDTVYDDVFSVSNDADYIPRSSAIKREVVERALYLVERERWYWDSWNNENPLPDDWPRNKVGTQMTPAELVREVLKMLKAEPKRTEVKP